MKTIIQITLIVYIIALFGISAHAQNVLETGGKEMPNEWIDKDTQHKIIKLTRNNRSNFSFYFHNNPFIGDEMVFYSATKAVSKSAAQETYNMNTKDKQLFLINLKTLQSERLTNHPGAMKGEIVYAKEKEVYYQVEDSVFRVNIDNKKEQLLYVFPSDFKGEITTVNADGTLLGGTKSCDEEKEIYKRDLQKISRKTRLFLPNI
jgi:hypothetical protein